MMVCPERVNPPAQRLAVPRLRVTILPICTGQVRGLGQHRGTLYANLYEEQHH
jgi:hypothetical protein